MEPLKILEEISIDIKNQFESDPLIMRTVNLIINEYRLRSKNVDSSDDYNKGYLHGWEDASKLYKTEI